MSQPHLPKPRVDPATIPPLLSTGDPNSFAEFTLKVRDPKILEDLLAAPFFSPDIKRGFAKLHKEILEGVIQPLYEDAPDADFWRALSKPYVGRSWLDVPWFWAETYFYRRILEIVGYFRIGAWHENDPFASQKQAELKPDAAPARVEQLVNVYESAEPQPRFEGMMHAALWGNRVDLSYNVERTVGRAASTEDERSNLLVDDVAQVYEVMSSRPMDNIVYVTDNAGTELSLDLALVDYLLAGDKPLARKITLHLKPQPFYVSDAMPQDVEHTLKVFDTANAVTRGIAQRLRAHAQAKRLSMRVHWFYPTPLHFYEMPDDLFALFRAADFVILKGDVNYRRTIGDAHWKPTMSFDFVTRYFPTPFVTLRTLKSDPIVGLTAAQVDALNHTDAEWRVNGKRGVAQARIKDEG